jgi:hypothetical protein
MSSDYIPTIRGRPLGQCTIEVLTQERKEIKASLDRLTVRMRAIDLAIRAKQDVAAQLESPRPLRDR